MRYRKVLELGLGVEKAAVMRREAQDRNAEACYPQRCEGISWRWEGKTLVLIGFSEEFLLGYLGGKAWELWDGSRSVSEALQLLGSDYSGPDSELESQLWRLLEHLRENRLIRF